MEIQTGPIALTVRDVICGDMLAIRHIRVESAAARLNVPIGSGPCAAILTMTLIIEEREINRILERQTQAGMKDLRVALMQDSLRITGRYEVMGPIAVPFTLLAVPRVEGGERIQFDVRDISVVGASLPGFSAQMIADKLNARMAETLNVRRTGLPLRLVSVTSQTGRLVVTAEAELEWNPAVADLTRSL